jgi:chemotaxis protein methyltransferase CheR
VPGIVWEVEVDPVTKQRTPTFASDYVKTVLGYTPEEWLATPGFGLQAIEAEDRERAFNESEKVVASGKGGVTQFRWRTKDGRLRWAETYFSPMIDNNEKKVVGLRGVTLDITDRKLAEETARQTEEKDRAILAAIPDLMFLQTRDGVYLDYHAKDSSYLLVPPEAFLGKNMHDVLPADLARQFAHCFARVQETSEPQILEYKLTRGEVDLWFEARMVRSGDNVLSVVRDITQRVFIEQAIKKHEAQLAGIIGSAMDAIITVDEGQRILLFNAAAEKIFGWPASEAIGQSLDEFIPERFRAAHRNHVHTFGDDNITRRRMGERGLSLYGLRRSGEEFPIDASISQLQLNGQTFSTVILRDISERKRAEAALKQSEANYRSIFNTANDAIFVHDLKTGRIYDVNERMCEMYGYTVDQVKQLTVADLSSNQPPYTQNEAFDFIQKAGAGEPQVFEWHAKKSSGELFWVEVGLRQAWLRGENCLLAVVRDITERKRAEAQLAESHRRVKEILESIGDAFYSLDKDLRFTYVNSKTEELWGRRREDLLGKKLLEVFPESIGTPSHDASMRAFEEGRPVNYEAMSPILHRWVEASVYPSAAGLSVYFRDITERKRAVDELRQSEERFAKAFNANPQPMSVTALADGRYLNVNDSFLAVSGYTREEVIGHTSLELGIWGTPKQRVAFVEQLLAKGSIVNTETNFYTKNGEPRFLLSSAERFEIGGQECLLVASSDITERKAAEEALVKAHEELVVAHEEVNRLKNQLEAENIYLQEELQEGQAFGDIVGQSAAIKYVLYKINQVAPIDSTVLITGETGTGKELVARAIHSASLRKDRPLIRVNCAALSPMLIESELFGHEKGAFTGAAALKLGRFEVANGGTLLLDEIGELPFDLQSKLLRVIQDGEFERVGGSKTVKVDVRIIAATNRDLKQEVEKGHFREDLWYRLNVFPITTPPLRDRRDDIPLLTDHFAGRLARKFGKPLTAVSPESMDQLCNYSWPGNVRELANVIERAVINSRGSVLRIREDFLSQDAEALAASVKTLEDMEREYITRVLQDLRWRVDGPHGAARVLGMNPSTLRTRMSKLGIQKPNGRSFSAS